MASILITGGMGYIGSHTAVELLEQNYEVIIVDDLSNSNVEVLDGIKQITHKNPTFYQVDCRDSEALQRIFAAHSIDGVIHFAAKKAVGESVEKPLLYYQNNLLSLITLLEVMQSFGVNSLVFSSSCTVYGQPTAENLPVKETAPILPALSPYGNTKQICEDIISDNANAQANFHSIILRYFNPIGAHPSALIGELPIGVPNNLLPFITQTAIGIRKELKVFGGDYNTPDGSCIRDYIYVVDLAKAHVKAIDRLLANSAKEKIEVFNLGTGTGVSVLEMVHAFIKSTGVDVPYTVVERREGDIEKVWADPSKANAVLNWFAKTPLDEILQSAWAWEKHVRNKKI